MPAHRVPISFAPRGPILALCLFLLANVAFASELSVRIEGRDFYKLASDDAKVFVSLDGEIDKDAPQRVEAALKQVFENGGGADVYLNSPGGSLFAGMQIGRLLRKYAASTHIGKVSLARDETYSQIVKAKFAPGICYSACTLAFIGGDYRYMSEGSEFGVHRFYSNSTVTSTDADTAQIVSAAVSAYIREMGASPELFDLMVQRGRDSVMLLSRQDLQSLNVVNNGRKQAQWSIEAIKGGQYLKGVQESVYGQGKAVFVCEKGALFLQSFYQAGSARATEIVDGKWLHSLLLDGQTVPLPTPRRVLSKGNEIFSEFILPREQALRVARAKSFGHAMQVTREAPTFVGYQIDISGAATAKVDAFISNCFQ